MIRHIGFRLAAAFIFTLSTAAVATVFVVVKTNDGYVVGGDSLRGTSDAVKNYCKVFHKRDTVIVVFGFMGAESPGYPLDQTDFHVMSAPALSMAGTPEARRGWLLHKLLSNEEFLAHVYNDTTFHWVGAVLINSHSVSGFRVTVGSDGTPIKRTNGLRSSVEYYGAKKLGQAFGENKAAQAYLDSLNLSRDMDTSLAENIVREALTRQAASTSRSVGAPFTIVHVSHNTVVNLEPGVCLSSFERPTK